MSCRIEDANLKISPSKCKLFQNSIRFLDHVISKDGIQTDPDKIAAVNSYPVPKTVKQVRAFLGLTEFYRKFIPSFGKIAQPLYNLLNKEKRFHWTEGCDKAFQSLKNTLRKRTQGESEKVTEFLTDLKLLAKKAYPDDSEEIREHLVMQAFLEGLLDQNVRLEIRKEKDISLTDALKRAVHLDAIYRLGSKPRRR